jgi:hypothetical protein
MSFTCGVNSRRWRLHLVGDVAPREDAILRGEALDFERRVFVEDDVANDENAEL